MVSYSEFYQPLFFLFWFCFACICKIFKSLSTIIPISLITQLTSGVDDTTLKKLLIIAVKSDAQSQSITNAKNIYIYIYSLTDKKCNVT